MSAAAVPLTALTPEQQHLVEENVGLAHSVAWRWIKAKAAVVDAATDREDLLATAYIGLCKAARVYDERRGWRFSTIAVPYINGEIMKHMRDLVQPGGMHVPRKMLKDPKPRVASLDMPMRPDEEGVLADLVGKLDELSDEILAVRLAVARLPLKLRTAITLRMDGWSQPAIARHMRVTQTCISRWLRQAHGLLRAVLSEGGLRVNLNAKQRKVLAVLQSLPAGAPVRRIGQAVGEDVTVDDMRPLVVAELVIEVQRTEGPLIGFSLTPDGDQLAAQIRQAHHPDILTPEMAGAPPEGSLRERVTPEMLLPALRAGWNIGKMALKFDATPKGLQQLITEYGLYNELAEEGRERQAGSQQAEEGKTVEAADKAKRTPGKMKQRKDELFALFDAGRGETWADKTALAQEFSCSDTTIDYWRRQWVIDRRHNPRPLAPETAPESPQPLVSITVDEAGQALATITGADPAEATEQIREQITDLAAPQVPAPETAPAIAVDDKAQTGDGPVEAGEAQQAESPPATREQLQALKDHFSGSQVRPADPILPELAPKLDKQPELQRPKVGEVLEAEVCKVDQAYVLVNLLTYYDGRRWLRGKISKTEVMRDGRVPFDCRDLLSDGDHVNVKVLRVVKASWGDRWNIDLSIGQAPPHEREPWKLQDISRPEVPPIVARGADVAVEEANASVPEVAATVTPATRPMSGPEVTDAAGRDMQERIKAMVLEHFREALTEVPNICQTCIKRDVCPIALTEFYSEPVELPDEEKPAKLKHMRVAYGRRFVQECSSYHRE